jgi:hypothetical protein
MLVLPLLAVLQDSPFNPEAYWKHPVGVEVLLGSPAGLLGVGVEVTPIPYLSLEGAIGWDSSYITRIGGGYGQGRQSSLMGRLRVPFGGLAFSVGAGASWGAYEWCDSCPFENGDQWNWKQAVWTNVEGAVEYRWRLGFGVRLSWGRAWLDNPNDVTCADYKYGCADLPPATGGPQKYLGIAGRIPVW